MLYAYIDIPEEGGESSANLPMDNPQEINTPRKLHPQRKESQLLK